MLSQKAQSRNWVSSIHRQLWFTEHPVLSLGGGWGRKEDEPVINTQCCASVKPTSFIRLWLLFSGRIPQRRQKHVFVIITIWYEIKSKARENPVTFNINLSTSSSHASNTLSRMIRKANSLCVYVLSLCIPHAHTYHSTHNRRAPPEGKHSSPGQPGGKTGPYGQQLEGQGLSAQYHRCSHYLTPPRNREKHQYSMTCHTNLTLPQGVPR